MNKKILKILVVFILTTMLVMLHNTVSNATGEVDFSWEAISGQAQNFIDAGEEGSGYINSGNMQNLVGRFRYYFNNYWWGGCTSWISSNRNTIYDGNTRRGRKVKNKASWANCGRGCYTRSLGDMEPNFEIFIRNYRITKEEEFFYGNLLYTT